MSRPGWLVSMLVGGVATAVALLLQALIRDVWQIRTLPERVMEWLLLFVPLSLFEHGLQQFGANAKEIALVGTLAAMALLLLTLGTLAVRSGWTGWQLIGTGVLLWLLAMAVVQPLTGGGFFATGLVLSPLLVNAGYLLVFLAYASVLVAAHVLLLEAKPIMRGQPAEDRRALLAGLAATLGALGVARVIGRDGGIVASNLPLASPPIRAPAPLRTPDAATAAEPTSAPRPVATPTVAASVNTPIAEPLPVPADRQLARNQDGSLTAAGRPSGTIAPRITANQDFFVVTKNAVGDPLVDAAGWRLIVDGEVGSPVQIDFRTLRALPSVEVNKTLECISNFTAQCNLAAFGCDLISTARWRGVRLRDVLDLAGGLKPGVVSLAFVSVDEFSAGLPPEIAMDKEALIVYEMNGEPLPREHGYPARLLVPGRYGMKNPKWLAIIRALSQDYLGWYEQRNWNRDGIVKTMARIDVPADGAQLSPGAQRIAGIAYAGTRGIMLVEYSANGGRTWTEAAPLEPPPGKDAMVRWEGSFTLAEGEAVTLIVRATDGDGDVQAAQFTLPQPDGATGRHAIQVSAA
ncbi:MAG TPA: molybdopterin-dependent oxidoreductase [Chloroflexota bacterium]|nr:molybdopterin-dependent oxidoreductase [Chloroflexota bacterium]